MNKIFQYEDGETGNLFHVLVNSNNDIIDIRADSAGKIVGSNLLPFVNEEMLISIEMFAEQLGEFYQ